MEINRENYEVYFLDYHEGRLVPGQVAELLVFLEAYPELKEEFEAYEDVHLEPEIAVTFPEKASLKKSYVPDYGIINLRNYENYFISYTEGLLSPKEQKLLTAFIKIHPELKTDFDLYQKSHVQADLTIKFPAKTKLRRSILNTRRFYYYSMATAASLALLFSIYLYTGSKHEPELAAVKMPYSKVLPKTTRDTQRIAQPEQTKNTPDNTKQNIAFRNSTVPKPLQTKTNTEVNTPERLALLEIQLIPSPGVSSRDLVEPKFAFIRQSRNNPEMYANLYDQVKLADHMKYDPVFTPVASSPKNILQAGLEKLGSVFTGKDLPANRNAINFWTLADLGISGYNLLTDKDLKLLTKSNDKGHVEAYALKGDEFEFAGKLKK
jgi:hypothetical protein